MVDLNLIYFIYVSGRTMQANGTSRLKLWTRLLIIIESWSFHIPQMRGLPFVARWNIVASNWCLEALSLQSFQAQLLKHPVLIQS